MTNEEKVMDALYRSYQLLGSKEYAIFSYYRSLAEQMRKDDVKVGEINEEELFSKKRSRQFHNRQDSTTSSYNDSSDKAKIHIKPIVAKELLDKLSKKYNVEMPIVDSVYNVLYNGLDPKEAVDNLMTRKLKEE